MSVLKSSLVATFHDRISGPARGAAGALGRLHRAGNRLGGVHQRLQAPVLGTTRNLVGLAAAYLGVREGIGGTLGGAMRFETAMADVAKKTTLTNLQLEQTEKTIGRLSNMKGGQARTEIAKLYAQAGQFGIANDELDRFVRLGSRASIAFDMTATDTANSLSKLKNALGLTMPGLEGLSDAINYSADTAGTSEKQLIDFLLRTAASARTYGISGQEMAAFGATLNEIGIESAKAGTGMNAMIAKLAGLSKNKKAIAALDRFGGKGYSAALQKKFYDRPVDAMREFFQIVQKMDAQTRSGLLIDFFGLEYQDDAAAIANNIDTIVGRLETLKDSSRFAGSVDRTFEIFANTSEEKLKRLQRITANYGAWMGSKVLPPIVSVAEKISDTLTTLDERVTVFDKIQTRMKGFMAGLGVPADGSVLSGMSTLWDTVFSRTDTLIADTDKMAGAFEQFRLMGDNLRSFADDIGEATGRLETFLGLDHGSLGTALGDLAGTGLSLGAAAVGVALFARPLKGLGKAALVLSGIKPAWSLLRFLKRLGALGGSAAGIAALARATGRLGTSAKSLPTKNPHGFGTVTKGSGQHGRIPQTRLNQMDQGLKQPPKTPPFPPLWGGFFSLWNAYSLIDSIPSGPKQLETFFGQSRARGSAWNTWLEDRFGSPMSWRERLFPPALGPLQGPPTRPDSSQQDKDRQEADERFDPMKGFNVLEGLEKRLGANGEREVSILGTPSVTLAADASVMTRPSGVQEVRVTNPSPPQITVHASIVVNEAQSAGEIAAALGAEIRSEMAGIQADTGWAGA